MENNSNNSILVSIIVPFFNASPYLDQCIGSISNQTLTNIEIILINDGSTDNSLQIVEHWLKKDKRIILYSQKNKGVSEARNLGLNFAKGKYVGFVDADDWIEHDMYELMYNETQRESVDWVISNINVHEKNNESFLRLKIKNEFTDISNNKTPVIHELLRFKYDFANWNKLFKKEIIDKNQIRFNNEMTLWEDLLFNLQYLFFINKIVVVDKGLYNYRILNNSLTRANPNLLVNQFNKLYFEFNTFLKSNHAELELITFNTEISRAAYYYLFNELYKSAINNSNNIKTKFYHFYKMIKELNTQICQVNPLATSFSQKIKYYLLRNKSYFFFTAIIFLTNWIKKND